MVSRLPMQSPMRSGADNGFGGLWQLIFAAVL